jgi:myo-inositol-1(or 4)-monophosphatase
VEYLDFAIELAHAGGDVLKHYMTREKQVELKSRANLVTIADKESEALVIQRIKERYPDHAILAEESGPSGSGEGKWIIDPLDGTTNFAHGYPQVSVSIALERGGQVILALVLDPVRHELFVARRGGGATLNDRPIHVSTVAELGAALLASGFPYDRRTHADFYLSFFKAFMMRTQGVRRAGSAALDLCWVAAGRVDGFWEWKLKPWDTAAGVLIVEEAGGLASDFRGGAFDAFGEQTLASNGLVHEEMLSVLATVLPAAG